MSGGPWTAPSTRVWRNPSVGDEWEPNDSFLGGINSQTGTSYTVVSTDRGKLLVFNNGSAVAVTLPQAGTSGFPTYMHFAVLNLGAGTVTITPTTSTINGASTKTYAQNASGEIVNDGTNYFAY